MNRMFWLICLMLSLGMAFPACDDDDDTTADDGDGDGDSDDSDEGGDSSDNAFEESLKCEYENEDGEECEGAEEYAECALDACDANYQECLGENYKDGDLDGVCAEYLECTQECECNETDCLQACTPSQECQDCFLGIAECITDSCELPDCGQPTTTEGGGCDALQACCDSLSGEDQTNCQTTLDQIEVGGDAACEAALSGYQASEQCT